MPSTAISAQGTTVKIDVAVAGTPDTDIANVVSFSGLDGEASEIDVTNLVSVAKEKRLGLQDFGSFSMEIHPDYADAGQSALRDAQASGTEKTFLVTLPDSTTLEFAGYVKNAQSVTGGVDAVVGGSVSITITGAVTIT